MTDISDHNDYAQPCACGHPWRDHTPLRCNATHHELDRDRLPAPVYDDPDNPVAWPVNWPPHNKAPRREQPCTCTEFTPASPEPDEEHH